MQAMDTKPPDTAMAPPSPIAPAPTTELVKLNVAPATVEPGTCSTVQVSVVSELPLVHLLFSSPSPPVADPPVVVGEAVEEVIVAWLLDPLVLHTVHCPFLPMADAMASNSAVFACDARKKVKPKPTAADRPSRRPRPITLRFALYLAAFSSPNQQRLRHNLKKNVGLLQPINSV